MKNIIRLTETDLIRIVKRFINENEEEDFNENDLFHEIKEIIDDSYSSDEDRNGNMYRYLDSSKAAEEIIFLLKIKNII